MTEIVNGVKVCDGWNARLAKAQKEPEIILGGMAHKRIRWGREKYPDGYKPDQPCHDCAAAIGQFHVPGCDMERCPRCKGQLIGCGCHDIKAPKRKRTKP